jgi:hypothetical protein
MKSSSELSPNPTLHDRCHHLSPSGRRCSQPACPSHPTLCFTHAPKSPSPEALIAAELSEAAGSLETPEDVNRLLTKTVLAFIAGRLPHKKAGMIGFLGQIILRTHREIVFHQNVDRDNHPENYHLFPDEYCKEPKSITDSPAQDQNPTAPTSAQAVTPPPAATIDAPVAPEPTNTPPPEILAPEKIPDLSHFYPSDPLLDPRFHAYNPIPYIPAVRLDDPVWPGEPPPETRPVYRKFAFRRKHY